MKLNSVHKGCRQGDVLLKPVSAEQISGVSIPPVNGYFVLAEGEESGHNHMVKAAAGIDFVSNGVAAFLTITGSRGHAKKPPKLLHQKMVGTRWQQADHDPVPIAPTTFEVVLQRRVMPGSKHLVVRVDD